MTKAVADDESSPRAARMFARTNQAYLLYQSGQFSETVDAAEQCLKDLPQAEESWTSSHVPKFSEDARKQLAAQTQPAARPPQ